MSRFSNRVAVLVSAPPALLGVAALLLALGVPPLRSAFWSVEPLNLAEAAAVRDLARIRQLAEVERADPNAVYEVRVGLLDDAPARLTPLEAGRLTGAADTIELLTSLGAR